MCLIQLAQCNKGMSVVGCIMDCQDNSIGGYAALQAIGGVVMVVDMFNVTLCVTTVTMLEISWIILGF